MYHYDFPNRYPSVPLIVHDPYFSIWSNSDKLYESWSTHWTLKTHSMCILVKVDDQVYRLAGDYEGALPLAQKSCQVWPTRSVYVFGNDQIELKLTFLSPLLPHRLEILSRPCSYLHFEVCSIDQAEHEVDLYFDGASEWAVDSLDEKVNFGHLNTSELQTMFIGSNVQNILNQSGDDCRIDWGFAYVAVPKNYNAQCVINANKICRNAFCRNGKLDCADEFVQPQPVMTQWVSPAVAMNLGMVGKRTLERTLMVAYDDVWSLEYLNRKVKAYYNEGQKFSEVLDQAWRDFESLYAECCSYDDELMEDCRVCGGEKYAHLCALSFRQAIGAHKLVRDGQTDDALFFSKENFSNGCIATVDVTYPSVPLFLLTSSRLTKGLLQPILDYACSRRWKFDFAPHDLGVYPLANGQVYGGGEDTEDDQMPIEECGNMLILMAALFKYHDEKIFVEKYFSLLCTWADYLLSKGYDPENQLCTDDFAGHLAHNCNLSLKAIIGLKAFANMAEALGKDREFVKKYAENSEKFSRQWEKDAWENDHYKLAFDQKDSWSQKYNLIWDKLLSLNLFSADVAGREIEFYLKKQNEFGVPLDSRADYTKLDWNVWTAALTENKSDFDKFIDPLFNWLTVGSSRVPLTDWYDSKSGKMEGFQARSVVGGIFIKLLFDAEIMEKYRKKNNSN